MCVPHTCIRTESLSKAFSTTSQILDGFAMVYERGSVESEGVGQEVEW